MAPEFEDLLRRARENDPEAWERLYDYLKPMLKPLVERMLRESAARRLLQPTDVFHSALAEFLAQPIPPQNLAAWLRVVMHNKVLQYQRRHEHLRTHTAGGHVDSLLGREEDPGQAVAYDDADAWVRQELREQLEPAVLDSLTLVADGGGWQEAADRHAPGTAGNTWMRHCHRRRDEVLAELRRRVAGQDRPPT
jgi:DNA-directed RNA polymerase specialized sigma24 family protein